MNTRRRSALAIASVMCATAVASGSALTAPAATAATGTPTDTVSAQTSWTKEWQSTIGRDYMQSHHKWVSQGYRAPNGTREARGVFSCTGDDDQVKLTVWNLDTGAKQSKTGWCDGDRHHTPVVAYQNGETLKLILKGVKTTVVEAWAGR
ncbi:hypothetical protein GCM10022403_084220 [Streptomyces coacervatus]|uniref:Secreted protein n=1 Tax=Streptomyces coacervatus TaxID=647381 RepID=A0ABP7JA53_9ACTN|nr:hypothetical protein [Streptomyces coacervatus]MDF2273362.1 hypothetical protein [Streptomyces coacervatus]